MKYVSVVIFALLLVGVSHLAGANDAHSFTFGFENPAYSTPKGGSVDLLIHLSLDDKGAYVHPRAPFQIELESARLKLSKEKLSQADASVRNPNKKARILKFPISVSGTKKGKHEVVANLEFFYCTAKICERKLATATANIHVK